MYKGKAGGKYWDDCSARVGSYDKKTYYTDGSLTEIRLCGDGTYGIRKRVEGKVCVVTMDQQPLHVVVLNRLYSKLQRDTSYQCRITYIEGSDCFVAEYMGCFPETVVPHGNAKVGSEYVRTHPNVLRDIAAALQGDKKQLKRTYDDMKASTNHDLERPRDKKQVRKKMHICTSLFTQRCNSIYLPVQRHSICKIKVLHNVSLHG